MGNHQLLTLQMKTPPQSVQRLVPKSKSQKMTRNGNDNNRNSKECLYPSLSKQELGQDSPLPGRGRPGLFSVCGLYARGRAQRFGGQPWRKKLMGGKKQEAIRFQLKK